MSEAASPLLVARHTTVTVRSISRGSHGKFSIAVMTPMAIERPALVKAAVAGTRVEVQMSVPPIVHEVGAGRQPGIAVSWAIGLLAWIHGGCAVRFRSFGDISGPTRVWRARTCA